MATFEVTSPDGRKYEIEGETQEGAIAAFEEYIASQPPPPPTPPPPAPADAQQAQTPKFNPAHHYPGTTPEQAAAIPPGFVYDPRTKQYRDVGLEAELASKDRGRLDAATTSIMQGSGARFGDEVLGLVGNVEGRVKGVNPAAMQNLRTQQARATIDQDQENFPGTSLTGEIGGAMVMPGASMKAGAGWLTNTLRASGVGGLIGGLFAAGDAEGGVADRAEAVPGGVAIGVVGGAASVPIAKAVSWASQKLGKNAAAIFRQRKYFNGQGLTDEGRAAFKAAGIDPDAVSEAFQREFARTAARSSKPVEAARATQMSEFGIPAYRANVTDDVMDWADFESARKGGLNQAAATKVGDAADAQMTAARRAGENIATDISAGNPADQFDAAMAVQSGLRKSQETARTAAGNAYDDLAAAGGGLRGGSVANLGQRIGRELEVQNVRIAPERTNATSALAYLDDVFKGADKGAVPFMEVERARQRLVGLRSAANRGSDGADQFAMGRIIDAFDAKVDELMETAMTEGGEATLELAKKARGLWAQYSKKYTGDGAASKFIQKIVDEDSSPDEVAKWLFTAGKLGTGKFNSTLASGLKETLGETSEAWSSIRQGAFRQLIQKPEGTVQPGPQAMSNNIRNFFNSPTTRALSRELFSDQERNLMLRYSAALKQMVPKAGATNYSGSGYENSRNIQRLVKSLAASLGFMSGGPAGAVVGAGAANAGQSIRTAGQVRNVLSSSGGNNALQTVKSGISIPPGFEAYDFTKGLFQGPQE